MIDKQNKLDDLRKEIDLIDDKMHQLLIKRTTLATEIAKAKGKTTNDTLGLAIRPSREASIHRRLLKNHSGDFPFASLGRMWREMINAFTLLQSNYQLAVFATPDDMRCWELARDQFGSMVKMTAYATVAETVEMAENSTSTIAIVPSRGLFNIKQSKVFLRLPFCGAVSTYKNDYDAFAIGQIALQSSNDDSTVTISDSLPTGAEQLDSINGKVAYAVNGFCDDTNSIGCYPNKIGR